MRVIAERLKQRRLDCHLKQKTLAEMSGVPASSISRAEQGKGGMQKEHIEEIAKVLDIPAGYLLGQDNAGDDINRDEILRGSYPQGLHDLASDDALCDELNIGDDDWHIMASLELPLGITKLGYVHVLCSVRFALNQCKKPL
jgi:transcriptional regulator with XRE-family HTH domain